MRAGAWLEVIFPSGDHKEYIADGRVGCRNLGERSLSSPDIFISHARTDAKIARRFADAFRAEGFDVWWDDALQAGETFDEAIETALRSAKAVVVLWSPDSVASRWVRAEATVGDQNSTLIPATIKPCQRPVIFELTQTADLTRWKGNRKDSTWREFVADVGKLVSGEARQARLEAAARKRPTNGRSGRRALYAFAAGFAALLLAAAYWWNGQGGSGAEIPLHVAGFDTQSGPQAVQFAQSLRGDVIDAMNDAGFPTTSDNAGAARSGMVLGGSVAESGDRLKVFAQIHDAKSGVTLWSQQFSGTTADSDRLAAMIATAAAEPLYELREINLQKGLSLAPDDLAKLMKGMQMIDNPRVFDQGKLRRSFEDAVVDTPNVAYAHSMLALTLVQDGARASPDQRATLFAKARAAAQDAFELSPVASGAAYDSLYIMGVYSDPSDIARQESLLLNGLRNSPDFPFLHMRECQFLMSVGRNEEAWSFCQRAYATRPLSAPIEWRFAVSLKMRGEQALAEQSIEQAVRYYPANGLVRLAKFDILAFGKAFGRAEPLLPAMLNQSEGFGDEEIAALKLYLKARSSGSAADSERAAKAIGAAATTDKLRLDIAVKALAVLGKTDEAFALLSGVSGALPPQLDQAPANPGTSFLFAPETAPLRADPRFWPLANRIGMVTYWMTSGKWPDFCGKQESLGQCKAAAAKARSA